MALASLAFALLLLAPLRSPDKNWLLEYYANPGFEGEPSTRAWAERVNFRVPGDGLLRGVPDRPDFSLRLRSCLQVSSPSDVRFGLDADEGARLFVDGKLVVDSAQSQTPAHTQRRKKRKTAQGMTHVDLTPGNHLLALEYRNTGGTAALRLEMTERGVSLQRPGLDGQCETP